MTDKITIETARLTLRPWRETDAPALYRYASDPRVSEPANWPRHDSEAMSLEVIRSYFMPAGHLFAITLKDSGEAVGCIGLVPSGDENYEVSPGMREVGYWIGYPHWGKGLTTEALRAFITYCGRDAGLSALLITANADNIGSQKVATNCGFTPVARYRHDGIDSIAYTLKISGSNKRVNGYFGWIL